MDNKYERYDKINTTAVCWIQSFSKKNGRPPCIKNFNIKSKYHLWLLEMFRIYSIYNKYSKYYIKSNIFDYIYLRFFKGYKHLKFYLNKEKICFIEPGIFIDEVTSSCNENEYIINSIYNAYFCK